MNHNDAGKFKLLYYLHKVAGAQTTYRDFAGLKRIALLTLIKHTCHREHKETCPSLTHNLVRNTIDLALEP